MGGEIYSGWMTHWTEKWAKKTPEKAINNFKFLLDNGYSWAMYMAHGGTNFGLTAGANGLYFGPSDYWGAITSYDYDAPINEQGASTPKYLALRNLITKYADW
jgi:beta-galactosidase